MDHFDMSGKLSFRTRLMELEPAARFARCLQANARFGAVEIVTSRRAKGERRFYVTYLPTSAARCQAIVDRQQSARVHRAEEQEFTFCADTDHDFCHCHSHSTGEVYEVTLENCSCPDWQFRCQAGGLACKHMIAYSDAIRRGEVGEFKPVAQRIPLSQDMQWAKDQAAFEQVFG